MPRTLYIFTCLAWFLQKVGSDAPWIFRDTILWGVRRPRRIYNFIEQNPVSNVRAGSSDDYEGHDIISASQEESDFDTPVDECSALLLTGREKKSRKCYDLVLDLRRRSATSGADHDESLDLRRLITTRCVKYLDELLEASSETRQDDSSSKRKIAHPKKLLHFLAPKVPAIKHSPDVNLRIHSARSDMDSGVAACIISILAHACEVYDKECSQRDTFDESWTKPPLAASELITDRRFEQLVECVTSGVNVKMRTREALRRKLDVKGQEAEDIEEILNEEDLQESDGLSIRDACRAAWGIAILCGHHLETLGGENVLDLLQALSLRTRELLLARLKRLQQDDLLSEPELAHLTTEERLNELAGELAEDAASAMWAFACVKGCTGLRSAPLFETCCSILCQDPIDLRRRAQEIDEENGTKNVGNNDVIDRLARSDATDDEKNHASDNYKEAATVSQFPGKDALVDWLSKTQINDIMWALALHGSENKTSSNDEITLSETAATLGEIAFDRIIEALEEDLKKAEGDVVQDTEHVLRNDVKAKENENMTVEVVDAAALLAARVQEGGRIPEESIKHLPVERMTLQSIHTANGEVQQVEVVDAAALLAASEGDNSVSFETEIMITSPPHPGTEESDRHVNVESSVSSVAAGANGSGKGIFSPHDLACIAWSVVELHDPLRMQVLPIVIRLTAMLGESATESLTGADLANLAWAVSRFEAEASSNEAHTPSSLSLSVISWIAHTTLQRARRQLQPSGKFDSHLLEQLQPPELGRLLWAVACVMSTYAQVPDRMRQDKDIRELAELALKVASLNLALFGAEDLLRICWAFLELCGNDESSFDPMISVSLGRILSTVEQSLYRWERGDCLVSSNGDSIDSHANIGSLFSSFFGRSRSNLPLLEQVVGDDSDDDNHLAPIIRKSRLPLLRDLSVDPSTLCKAACAFQRLLVRHPEIKGGWKLTTVAIRLLSSKNARLMKECTIHDIVRLCEAAVRSDGEGHGRELINGLFAHKVVQVLNEVLDESKRKMQATACKMSAASPAEIATLTWALGDLGVKHSQPDESRDIAYKRLRLVTDSPLMTEEQVRSLGLSSLLKLLRGMVLMKYFQSDPQYLLVALKKLHAKASKLESGEELCSLGETLALLKEALRMDDTPTEASKRAKSSLDVTNHEESPVPEGAKEGSNTSSVEHKAKSIEEELVSLCDELLTHIAHKAAGGIKNFPAQELRRLLSVYSLLPFQADDLIDDIDAEVQRRLPSSDTASPILVEEFLQEAREKSESVQRELFQETESSTLSTLKNGIMSLFRSTDDNGPTEETNLPEGLSALILASINSTVEASAALQEMQELLHVSIDSIGQQSYEGTYFELGRCQELIANYRRVEFSTGTRRSRYDKERRKEMSKRVLSRLLP